MASEPNASVRFAVDIAADAREPEDAAKTLERLQKALQDDLQALRGMQQAFRNMKGEAGVSKETISQLKDQMAATKSRIAGTQQSVIKLGGGFRALPKPTNDTRNSLSSLFEAASKAGGPLGSLMGRLGGISRLVAGGIMVAGITAVTAATLALAAATVAASGALVLYGLRQADARRNELLRLEGLTKIRHFMGGFAVGHMRAADSAGFLQSAIDGVADKVPLAREEIGKLTDQLYKMGLRGGNLQAALEGASITQAVQGDEQAQRFAHWAAGAALVGQSVRKLADDVKARLGGIAERRMLSLDVSVMRLKQHMARLFADVKIEGFLRAFKQFVDLFSQGEAVGRALKVMLEAIFGSLDVQAGGTLLIIKRFFQGITIAALRIILVAFDIRDAWRRIFGRDTLKGFDLTQAALYAGIAVASIFVGVLAALAIAALTVAAAMALVALPFIIFGASVYAALRLLDAVYEGFVAAGRNLVEGLKAGILGGGPSIAEALVAAAKTGIAAFKKALGIASPSKVMARLGVELPRGGAVGIQAGIPEVRRAADALGDASVPRNMGGVTDLTPRIVARDAAARSRPSTDDAPRLPPPAPPTAPAAAAASALPAEIRLHVHVTGGTEDQAKAGAAVAAEEFVRVLRAAGIAIGAVKAA